LPIWAKNVSIFCLLRAVWAWAAGPKCNNFWMSELFDKPLSWNLDSSSEKKNVLIKFVQFWALGSTADTS
jgi:hypothetical protein